MIELHRVRQAAAGPVTDVVRPVPGLLRWLRVRLVHLTSQQPDWAFETGDEEAVLDILAGVCSLNVGAPAGGIAYPEIGGRESVFGGKPTMVYIPRDTRVSIFAESPTLEAILASAPARGAHAPAIVFPHEADVRTVGKDNWQRTVVTSIGDNVRADRLIVGETINPPGNWSSAPPHKHDTASGDESPMEEIYYYRLNPPQGFGLQRVYTHPEDPDSFDVTYTVRDGDLVAIPRGYHPVVAAPGYQLFYLWVLAGDERRYGAWSDDPEHAWIKGSG